MAVLRRWLARRCAPLAGATGSPVGAGREHMVVAGACSSTAPVHQMSRSWLLVLDVVAVELFVGIGRSVHGVGMTLPGMASTSWPFLTGMAAGWAASTAWRRPARVLPVGLVTWLATVAGGMALRVVAGQGTAVPFIGVALGFLGATMIGWRLVAQLLGPGGIVRQKLSRTVPQAAGS